MKYKIVAAGLVVILSIVPFGLPTALAQEIGQPAVGTWNLVEAVPPGDSLEIRLKNGETRRGKVRSVTATGLTLLHKGGDTSLRREDISRVYQTVRKSAKKPVLIGAAAGSIIGVAAGAAVNDKKAVKTPFTILLIGGVTAAVGALVGWGIAGRKSNVLIYEAR